MRKALHLIQHGRNDGTASKETIVDNRLNYKGKPFGEISVSYEVKEYDHIEPSDIKVDNNRNDDLRAITIYVPKDSSFGKDVGELCDLINGKTRIELNGGKEQSALDEDGNRIDYASIRAHLAMVLGLQGTEQHKHLYLNLFCKPMKDKAWKSYVLTSPPCATILDEKFGKDVWRDAIDVK